MGTGVQSLRWGFQFHVPAHWTDGSDAHNQEGVHTVAGQDLLCCLHSHCDTRIQQRDIPCTRPVRNYRVYQKSLRSVDNCITVSRLVWISESRCKLHPSVSYTAENYEDQSWNTVVSILEVCDPSCRNTLRCSSCSRNYRPCR